MGRSALTSQRFAPRNYDYSVLLAANNSQIEVVDSFSPSTNSFTIYMWVKVNKLPAEYSPSNHGVLFGQKNGSGTGRAWLYIDSATNKMSSALGGTSTWDFIPLEGVWYRMALTKFGNGASSTINLFVNGVSQGEKTVNPGASVGNFVIGNDKDGTAGAFVNIVDVALGSQAYTLSNIRFIENDCFSNVFPHASAFTRFRLKMTDGAGLTVTDSSVNGRNGTITNGSWSTESPFKTPLQISSARTALTVARSLLP